MPALPAATALVRVVGRNPQSILRLSEGGTVMKKELGLHRSKQIEYLLLTQLVSPYSFTTGES